VERVDAGGDLGFERPHLARAHDVARVVERLDSMPQVMRSA
jgi:hypothetical protein